MYSKFVIKYIYIEALGKVFVALYNFLFEGYFFGHTKTFMRWEAVGNGGLKL